MTEYDLSENKKKPTSEIGIQFGADTIARQYSKIRGEMVRNFEAMGHK